MTVYKQLCSNADGLLLAGQRPSSSTVATGSAELDLCLLRDCQSIIDLDAEIPYGAFALGVPEQ